MSMATRLSESHPLRADIALAVLDGLRRSAANDALLLRRMLTEHGVPGFHQAADYVSLLTEAIDELERIATRGCGQPNGECLRRCHLGVNDG